MAEAVGLDTSVVLRLLIGEPADQAAKALNFLADLRAKGNLAEIGDLVVSEVYFALQHHYGIEKKDALAALKQLAQSGDIVFSGAAARVLTTTRNLSSAKPGFVDRLIHAGYLDHGCSAFATFEKSAKRLPDSKVIG